MSSQIQEIYRAISDMEIIMESKIVRAKAPSELVSGITTAILPIRLLTPISRFAAGFGQTMSTWNAGEGSQVNMVDWVITDLFLYEPLNQKIGIKANADALVEYCKMYLDAAATGKMALPANSWISNISLRPDVIDYPIGSGVFYYGVVALLQITEKIP